MGKLLKSISMILAYLLCITLLPIDALRTEASAFTENYQYNYQNNYFNINYDSIFDDFDLNSVVNIGTGNDMAASEFIKDINNVFLINSNNNVLSFNLKFDYYNLMNSFLSGKGNLYILTQTRDIVLPLSLFTYDEILKMDITKLQINPNSNDIKYLEFIRSKLNPIFMIFIGTGINESVLSEKEIDTTPTSIIKTNTVLNKSSTVPKTSDSNSLFLPSLAILISLGFITSIMIGYKKRKI